MKKFLLIFILGMTMPGFALCPIGDGETVCSLENNNLSSETLFQNTSSFEKTNNNSMNSPSQLNTQNNSSSFGRIKNSNGIQMQGSLSCQFGNCNDNSGSTFLPNQ